MPGRGNKTGEGEGVAAVAGTVLNNQWFGLRFCSPMTLADAEGDGKTALWQGFGSWNSCQSWGPVQTLQMDDVPAQCPLICLGTLGHVLHTEQWVTCQEHVTTTPHIPGQRRIRKGYWFVDALACGYKPLLQRKMGGSRSSNQQKERFRGK